MYKDEITNKISEKESLIREREGYKIQARSLDLTRKINFFLFAACIVGIFYDGSIKQWWLNQYVVAGILFGLISFFSHKKWAKIVQPMDQVESQIKKLENEIDKKILD